MLDINQELIMGDRTEHRRQYKKIPKFKCVTGCNGCCGPVPVTEYEAKRLGIDGPLTPTKKGTFECVFSSEKGCTQYNNRPFLCRLFGTSTDIHLTCPRGGKPKSSLSKIDCDFLTKNYMSL